MDKKTALFRLEQYCARGERSRKQLEDKLKTWQLPPDDREVVLAALEAENFFNDTRFTRAFIHDKFKLQYWGKNKIAAALYQKGIRRQTANQLMQEVIEDEAYREVVQILIKRKAEMLPDDLPPMEMKQKVANFLLQRGFEPNVVWEELGGEY